MSAQRRLEDDSVVTDWRMIGIGAGVAGFSLVGIGAMFREDCADPASASGAGDREGRTACHGGGRPRRLRLARPIDPVVVVPRIVRRRKGIGRRSSTRKMLPPSAASCSGRQSPGHHRWTPKLPCRQNTCFPMSPKFSSPKCCERARRRSIFAPTRTRPPGSIARRPTCSRRSCPQQKR